MLSKYQFVSWFPGWIWFGFTRLDPKKTCMALVYEWYLWLGFWEARKWCSKEKQRELLARMK